jgi:site-specific DNA-methyltransferase (adenine-specific)
MMNLSAARRAEPGARSSASDEWETPPEVFGPLNEYFKFTLDPCATAKNAKCRRYFTRAEDGLVQSWAPEKVFMNPPFGRRQIGDWVRKAYEEAGRGALCVCLLPASTDTAWWHDYVEPVRIIGDVWFLRGRVRFRRPSGTVSSGATFPSTVVIFRPQRKVRTLSIIHRRLGRLARGGFIE